MRSIQASIDNYKSKIGTRIGHSTIIDYIYDVNAEKTFRHMFKCQCDCGHVTLRKCFELLKLNTIDCKNPDCSFKNDKSYLKNAAYNRHSMRIGEILDNRLLLEDLIYYPENNPNNRYVYKCKCVLCGYTYESAVQNINSTTAKCKNPYCESNNSMAEYKNYIGQTIGHLKILDVIYDINSKIPTARYQFKCLCECGNETYKPAYDVINGQIQTCTSKDCTVFRASPITTINKYKSYIGQIIGGLKIIDVDYDATRPQFQHYMFKCQCECGSIVLKKCYDVISGNVSYCGLETCNCNPNSSTYQLEDWKTFINTQFNEFTILDAIYNPDSDSYSRYQFKLKCSCGNEYYYPCSRLLYEQPYSCNQCYCSSKVENDLKTWLISLDKSIIIHNRIPSINQTIQTNIEIDFLFEDSNFGIELHGLSTHATVTPNYKTSKIIGRKPRKYHLNKLNSAIDQKIDLIQIWNSEWEKKKDICKSIILHKLGLSPYKGYARQCYVKEVDKKISDEFLTNNHIQGPVVGDTIRLGLFYKANDTLVSIMTFGRPRYNSSHDWEMFRFANHTNCNIIGSASKLFKCFIDNYNPNSIISYSDRRLFNSGKLYEILGFTLTHISPPSYWYFKQRSYNEILEHRSKYMKHMLKDKLKTFDPNLTEVENMEANGYLRVYDCGTKVYSWKSKPLQK